MSIIPGVGLIAGLDGTLEANVATATQVTLPGSYFSAGDWAANTDKRLVIPVGVSIGSNAAGTAALNCGTGRGGRLEIQILGSLLGAGGQPSAGQGGTALYVPQSGVTITGNGQLKGGGGAGSQGGTGGAGQVVVNEGPFYDGSSYYWFVDGGAGSASVGWPGGGGGTSAGATSFSSGGWTYFRGGSQGTLGDGRQAYAVSRQSVTNTTGGAGGAGGRGQGYDGAAASGVAGSVGGTNAGTGGTGGAGGAYGASGSTGATGTAGNNGAGVAAASGGLAGYYIDGIANVTNLFTGTTAGLTR